MTSITDFFLSVASSVIGNKITANKSAAKVHEKVEFNDGDIGKETIKPLSVKPLANPRDGRFGEKFINLVGSLDHPNIFLFIESEPSTFYNLVTVIVEDYRTGDWYPFDQPVAFQGSGGGWNETRSLIDLINNVREKGSDVCLSIRVAYSEDLAGMLAGTVTWIELKHRSIPALIAEDDNYRGLQSRFESELLRDNSRNP